MKKILVRLIKLYRKYISPMKSRPSCRFYPTCSQYAIEALETHGVFCGILLTVWRILRCNPFCRGGFDPVPDKFLWSKKAKNTPETNISDEDDYNDGENLT